MNNLGEFTKPHTIYSAILEKYLNWMVSLACLNTEIHTLCVSKLCIHMHVVFRVHGEIKTEPEGKHERFLSYLEHECPLASCVLPK